VHTNSRSIILTLILAIVVTARPAAIFSASANGISVSLITILPGRSLYSAFGHSAIRIVDRQKGTDRLYNYGLSVRPFDARFVLGMLTGHMEFMVAALNTQESFAFYSEVENRTIIEQVLNLDAAQIDTLMSTLKHDIRPENRIYNYRYFSDNCATRVWELLAPLCVSLEGKDVAQPQPTLRDQLHRAMADSAWLRTTIDLLLGPIADRPQPHTAPLFLPKQLMDTAAASNVAGRSGQVPFIQSSSVVFQAKKAPAPTLSITPLAAAILVLTASLISLFPTVGKKMLIFDAVLFALVTLAGACILLFWLAAGYPEVACNLNLLWANPLPLVALIVSRLAPKSHVSKALSSLTAAFAFLCAATGGLGLQHIQAELRILALAVGVRCLSHAITPNARPASVDKTTTRPT
jgi:hypothetical protein